MDPRFFYMFHNTRDDAFFTVRHGIDIDFNGIFEELVNEDRPLRRRLSRFFHKGFQIIFGIDNLHCPTTEHIRRTDHHGITYGRGDLFRFIKRYRDTVIGLSQAKVLEERLELVPVFRNINAFRRRTDNLNPGALKRHGKVEGCLPTELDNHTIRLFVLGNIKDILKRKGLKVELVRRVVVGAYRFRIAVHHDRLISQFFQGKRGMDTAVVKFDTLPYSVGSSSEDHDLFPV